MNDATREHPTDGPDAHETAWSPSLLFGLSLIFWLALGCVDAVQYRIYSAIHDIPMTWTGAAARTVHSWLLWGLLTPVVVWWTRRAKIERDRVVRGILLQAAFGTALIVVHVLIFIELRQLLLHRPLFPSHFPLLLKKYLADMFLMDLFIYIALVGAVHAYDYHRAFRDRERIAARLRVESVRLQALLAEAKLDALKMQMHPHFLFNTLHAVSTMILKGENRAANEMLSRLSDFLRMALENTAAAEVPLTVELEFLEAYVQIQLIRFQDRLKVDIDMPDDLLDVRVPNLILQPLVENSIRHGIAVDPRAGHVRIRGRRENAHLVLEVEDDGPGLNAGDGTRAGVGLSNIRARLEQLYGGDSRLELLDGTTGGALARLTIPARVAASGPHVETTR